MSFFVSSVGMGRGGNLGGLAGADAHCQALAAAAGRGAATWRAYLSTQGPGAVHARDRIGTGPWYNARGQVIARSVAELHGDTLEQARIGNFIGIEHGLDERGQTVPYLIPDTEHDILTGSQLDGRAYPDTDVDRTCSNWTSDAAGTLPPGPPPDPFPAGAPSARVGHSDKGNVVPSWNSSHQTPGCSEANLRAIGGRGRLYCFAVN
ncbi:MAG: lectin [Acidobacteria bacterium]|nr:lectin [Acidobacteriota bacterium]